MKDGWKTMTMGDVADITDYVANGSFASLRENVSYKSEKDYAVLVRLADYSNGFDESKFIYIDKHSYDFLSKSSLKGGEIIMSNVGSVGKLFICPNLGMPMSLAPNSIVIKTEYNKFYYYLLMSKHYQNQILSITSKTALPKFNKTSFKKILVSVPTFSEQQHIVSELDLLQSIIDKQQAQLKELDKLAQAVFYDMFGSVDDNNKGFNIKCLGEVFSTITDGTHQTPQYTEDKVNGYKFLSAKDVVSGTIDWSKIKYIPESLHHELHKRLAPQKGDILLCKNGTTGICALVETDEVFDIYVSLALLRTDNDYNKHYLVYAINNPSTKKQFDDSLKGVGVPNLHLGEIKKAKIIIPPLHLQESFAAKIESIDKQKAAISQSLAETQKLFDYTMDKYFG